MRRYQDILLVTVNPGLAIVGVVPPAMLGVAYSATLTAFGGVEPYQWAIVGGAIPDDFTATVDSAGNFVISGTESDVPDIGEYLFNVLLRDSSGKSVTKRFSLRVVAEPLVIVGDAPDGTFGVPYSYDYAITGGVPPYYPYLWIGDGYGPLPDGLTLTQPSTNVLRLEGTPTAGQFNVSFKIAANDSQSPTSAFAYVTDTMSIIPDNLIVAGTFLDTDIGDPLNGSPLAISGGIPPYSLSGSPYSGTRPAGVSIAVVGAQVVATGNTTTVGAYSWTERVMDSVGDHFDVVNAIDVEYPTLVVTGAFANTDIGDPLNGSPLAITGGDGSYSLSGAPYSGTRPAGVTISVVGSSLVASGNTTTAASYSWTERVLSGDGQHFDVVSSIDVQSVGIPPSAVAGCTFWIDGTDASTLYKDGAHTIPVTSSGDNVGAAQDKIAPTRYWLGFSNPGAGNAIPTYQTAVVNSKSVIRCSGSTASWIQPSGIPLSTLFANNDATAVFAVYSTGIVSATSPDYNKASILRDASLYFGAYIGPSPDRLFGYNYDGSADYASVNAAQGVWRVLTVQHKSGNLRIRLDGGSWTTVASGNTSVMTGAVYLGKYVSAGTTTGTVELAHACGFNTISDPDLADVERWIGNEIGIVIP